MVGRGSRIPQLLCGEFGVNNPRLCWYEKRAEPFGTAKSWSFSRDGVFGIYCLLIGLHVHGQLEGI
jgi:hypothetical protein